MVATILELVTANFMETVKVVEKRLLQLPHLHQDIKKKNIISSHFQTKASINQSLIGGKGVGNGLRLTV